MPSGDEVWNCPRRVTTAIRLIELDPVLEEEAKNGLFDKVRSWFEPDDITSFFAVVYMYCQRKIDDIKWRQLQINLGKEDPQNETYALCCWIEREKEYRQKYTRSHLRDLGEEYPVKY
jgi:hypothetical protein